MSGTVARACALEAPASEAGAIPVDYATFGGPRSHSGAFKFVYGAGRELYVEAVDPTYAKAMAARIIGFFGLPFGRVPLGGAAARLRDWFDILAHGCLEHTSAATP
jgi:hypothetical protein